MLLTIAKPNSPLSSRTARFEISGASNPEYFDQDSDNQSADLKPHA